MARFNFSDHDFSSLDIWSSCFSPPLCFLLFALMQPTWSSGISHMVLSPSSNPLILMLPCLSPHLRTPQFIQKNVCWSRGEGSLSKATSFIITIRIYLNNRNLYQKVKILFPQWFILTVWLFKRLQRINMVLFQPWAIFPLGEQHVVEWTVTLETQWSLVLLTMASVLFFWDKGAHRGFFQQLGNYAKIPK